MNSRVKKTLVIVPLICLGIFAGLFLGKDYLKALAGTATCAETVESELKSPNQRFVATVFLRNCGATTEIVTHVNLRSSGEVLKPDADGVIRDGEVFVESGQINVRPEWEGDNVLVLSLPGTGISSTSVGRTWGSVTVRMKK